MTVKPSYSYEDLIACGHGQLIGANNLVMPKLPLPPMLMFDRIVRITGEGGAYGKGEARAEFDIKPDHWFFKCHFENDPVMPGCLGLDAVWQLLGFFVGWSGAAGQGRALGVGEVKFSGMVLPKAKLVTYILDIKRVIKRKLVLGIADGAVKVDGEPVFACRDLKVGLFEDAKAS